MMEWMFANPGVTAWAASFVGWSILLGIDLFRMRRLIRARPLASFIPGQFYTLGVTKGTLKKDITIKTILWSVGVSLVPVVAQLGLMLYVFCCFADLMMFLVRTSRRLPSLQKQIFD